MALRRARLRNAPHHDEQVGSAPCHLSDKADKVSGIGGVFAKRHTLHESGDVFWAARDAVQHNIRRCGNRDQTHARSDQFHLRANLQSRCRIRRHSQLPRAGVRQAQGGTFVRQHQHIHKKMKVLLLLRIESLFANLKKRTCGETYWDWLNRL